jgi:signal transduction histidine kinase
MRRRLVLAIVAVATAAVVAFAVPLALVLRSSYRDAERARLQRDTVAATRAIDLGAPGGDPIELPRSRDVIGVYDRTGRRVAGHGPPAADAVVRAALGSGRTADGAAHGALLAAVPLMTHERVTGVVRATRDADAVNDRVSRAWLGIAGLAAVLVAAAALAALLLGRRLAGPLERLAGTARRLGDGDFTVRSAPSGVAELDAVGAALDATAERLDELVSRERAFSADASHQLRTPLAALRLELETIELGSDPSEELTAALAQVDRLQATIDTLLDVARDAPRRSAHCDLRTLLDEVEQQWAPRLAAHGRPLRTLVRARRPVALASAGVVSEVLDVLVANADRHGGGAVTLTVRDTQGWLAVDVADEGPGLSGDPESAFTRRAPMGDGHGIGLALARSLAHAEGGRLTVSSPGPEPTFTLLLRVATPPDA